MLGLLAKVYQMVLAQGVMAYLELQTPLVVYSLRVRLLVVAVNVAGLLQPGVQEDMKLLDMQLDQLHALTQLFVMDRVQRDKKILDVELVKA